MIPDDSTTTDLPQVSGYRTVSLAAAGSRARVYRARDLATQDVVALKVFDEDRPHARDELHERLMDAVVRLGAIESATLVRPTRVARTEASGRVALAMEYVDGDSLAMALQRGVSLPPERAAAIAAAVAAALGEAARAGVCHGNLHGGKIILGVTGPRLLGLGLRETLPAGFEDIHTGGRVSPHVYADDGVLSGNGADAAADVFSLGALLYHMLTGFPPHAAGSLATLRVERADGPLVWPRGAAQEFPVGLVNLVDRMTAPDRSSRPAVGDRLGASLLAALKRSRTPHPVTRERPSAVIAPPPPAAVEAAVPDSRNRGVSRRLNALMGSPPVRWGVPVAAAALLLGGIALALRGSRDDDAPRAAATPAPAASAAATRMPPSDPPPVEIALADEAAPRPDPSAAELRAIEAVLADEAADPIALRARLEPLARQGGDAGVRATVLLARIDAAHAERAERSLARLIDRSAALEAAGRFGDALAIIEEFPHEVFSATPAARRTALEADALSGRAAKAYADVAARAEVLASVGDFAGARSLYAGVRGTIGLATWVERAETALRDLGRREEDAAARAQARKEAEAAAELHEEFERGMRSIARSCRTFTYTDAERQLGELASRPLSAGDGATLAGYADLVSREAAHFRQVAARIRLGTRQGFLNFVDSPRSLVIRDITEEGLELGGMSSEDESLRSRFAWSRLPEYQTFKLMLDVGSELTSIDERIALAVFCRHRGLVSECENELRVAGDLARSKQLRDLVARVRAAIAVVPVDR